MQQQVEKAIQSFNEGYNCAQSVLSVFADELEIDMNFAMSISSGFGAGMGRLQETCGAVTGAFMVIGLYNRKKYANNIDLKEASSIMIQEFTQNFKSANRTISCKSLLNCDLNTPEGQEYFDINNLIENVCEKCIADSIRIINKLIEK